MFVADAGQPGDRASTRRPARCCGATGGRCPTDVDRAAPTPAAASRCTATRCSSPPAKRCSSRSTRGPAREVWTTKVADNKNGYYMSLAPLVADGKVMVGASGGEFGIRGFVAAFDAETGKELWRTYTVPAPGEPGSETWPKGDQWKTGGGSVWVTGNYDPETNLAFWGTGNGGPWMGDQRPGDNLYTSSTIAHRRRDRHDQGPLPVPPERLVGLGRGVAADPRRLPAQRPDDQGADRRRARRLSVVPRAHATGRSTSSRASRS